MKDDTFSQEDLQECFPELLDLEKNLKKMLAGEFRESAEIGEIHAIIGSLEAARLTLKILRMKDAAKELDKRIDRYCERYLWPLQSKLRREEKGA